MTFLAIIFIPPLYFLTRSRWGGFIINAFFYGVACLLVLTIAGIAIAPFPWLIAVAHAAFSYRKELVVEHADILATKMAEKMRNEPPVIKK